MTLLAEQIRGGFKSTAAQKTNAARKDYWSTKPNEVYEVLGTTETGLSEQEAQRRLKTYGQNELPRQAFSFVQILIRQFKNPIFAILIAAALVAGFFDEIDQSIAIISMIIISVVLGFYNEYKAEKIVESLRQSVSFKALVTREGKSREIDSKLVVPGDLVSVNVGDIVPADMRIVKSKDLQTNEATLTGESFPVEKTIESLVIQQPIPQELRNFLFMGTVVAHGNGMGIVFSTGKNTEFGSISKSLARSHPETEFQRGIKKYGNLLLTLTVALTISIFAVDTIVGKPLIDSLLFSLAIAIGLVPELMPAIVTISLSQGARRMSKQRVVVKRLVSIEDFGNMNILCTDKTGTLTDGKIALKDFFTIDQGKDPRILPYSLLCNSAVVNERISGNPMDAAIWEYVNENGGKESLKLYTKIDEVPFDYERRMMSVIVKTSGNIVFITKGAPESVMAKCKFVENEGRKPLCAVLESINGKFFDLSQLGYRVLAVAYKTADPKISYSVEDERDLTFLGFLVFTDPPKTDAHRAIEKLKEMGVGVKILTGDNELVARKICDDIRVPVKKIVSGPDLAKMSFNEIKLAVEEATIFFKNNSGTKTGYYQGSEGE